MSRVGGRESKVVGEAQAPTTRFTRCGSSPWPALGALEDDKTGKPEAVLARLRK